MSQRVRRGGRRCAAAVAVVVAAVTGCKAKDEGDRSAAAVAERAAASRPAGDRLHIAVSVDWEGAYLSDEGLDAIEQVGRELPGVPISHFVCPAYLAKPEAERAAAIEAIRTALRDGDEIALHIHAWRSLADAAGIPFRASPSFLAPELVSFADGDQGFEVELGAYTAGEIGKLVATSRGLLVDAGFAVAPVFRTGGYVATARVLAALRKQRFEVDSSAVDPAALADEAALAGAALPGRLRAIWPDVGASTQPYLIETPAGPVLEFPVHVADYLTGAELLERLRSARAAVAAAPGRDRFIGVVFHQETGGEYAPAVIDALKALRAEAGPALVFETASTAAAAARSALAR